MAGPLPPASRQNPQTLLQSQPLNDSTTTIFIKRPTIRIATVAPTPRTSALILVVVCMIIAAISYYAYGIRRDMKKKKKKATNEDLHLGRDIENGAFDSRVLSVVEYGIGGVREETRIAVGEEAGDRKGIEGGRSIEGRKVVDDGRSVTFIIPFAARGGICSSEPACLPQRSEHFYTDGRSVESKAPNALKDDDK